MFILSSLSSGLEFWSVNHTSVYENSELKVFRKEEFLGKTSNNWRNNLHAHIYTSLLNNGDCNCLQYYNRLMLLP